MDYTWVRGAEAPGDLLLGLRTSDWQASSLAGSASNVEHIYGAVCAIDPEEHPIHLSGAPIMEYAHRTFRVGTLGRDWTPPRGLIE
jgi:hypothetical protein